MKTPLHGKRFYCREWVFSKIAHYMDNGRMAGNKAAPPGCLIVGGAGCGKTAICCEIVRPTVVISRQAELNARLVAYHFCHTHLSESCSASAFVLSVVEQLVASQLLVGYKEQLNEPGVRAWLDPTTCDRFPMETFKNTVLEPLNNLAQRPEQSLCLVVDSLHETCTSDADGRCATNGVGVLELLAQTYSQFPDWLFLVCTTRRQCKFVDKSFGDFRRIQLDDLRRSCVVRDVQQYILRRLDEEEPLRAQLNMETAEMLNQLHIKSNGCVLYLELVLDGVAECFLNLREIKHIPSTLNGLYLWLCQRLFCKKTYARVQAVLNVLLAAASRNLTFFELYQCVWLSDTALTYDAFVELLKSVSRLLAVDESGNGCQLFHNSFAEWLVDVKYSTQKYLCDKSMGHAYLAMWYSCRARQLSESEIVDFAYHLSKFGLESSGKTGMVGSPTAAVQKTFLESSSHLATWLVQSGAPVHNLVLRNSTVDEATTRLLVEAGADFVSLDFQGISSALPVDELEEPSADLALVDDTSVDQDGRTVLHRFAADGNADVVQGLLSKGAFCDVEDTEGNTPLLLSARQGHADVSELLLEAGADCSRVNAAGWTPLRSAAWGGHLKVVECLLKFEVAVDCSSSDGRTALRAASWGGHDECVMALLAAGADPNKADVEGRTPLIAAAYMGHKEIVEILLDAGADANHKDKDGRTALNVAAMCSSLTVDHTSVARLLLERGADAHCVDNNGKTPLLCAAAEGHYEMCRLLLAYDADVDHNDVNQSTPLLAAASMGHERIIDLLLASGACLDTIDMEGRTVLTVAAAHGSLEVVRMLLNKNLDEMHKDNHGWIPLHHAAFEGQSEVCRLLAQYNAKTVHMTDHEGRHPLVLAVEEGHVETARTLLDVGGNINKATLDGRTVLRIACVDGNKDMAHMLISRGADVNHKDLDGTPTIYALFYERQLEMAEFLLSYGTDVDNRDSNGRTSLHVACWHGDAQAVELLVKYGADVNAADVDKRTPLMVAVWRGQTQIAKILLNHRADVNAESVEGATALSVAAQEGREDIIRLLLQYHASNEHTDKYGRTASMVAAKAGHERISAMLQDIHESATLPGSCSNTTTSGGSNNSASSAETKASSGFMSLSQALCSSLESPFGTMNAPPTPPAVQKRGSKQHNNCGTHSSNRSAGHTSSTLSSSCGSPEDDFSRRLLEKSLPRGNGRPQSIVVAKSAPLETLSIEDERKLNDLATAVREAVAFKRVDGSISAFDHDDGIRATGPDACLQFLNDCIVAASPRNIYDAVSNENDDPLNYAVAAESNQRETASDIDEIYSSNVFRQERTVSNGYTSEDSMTRRRNQIVTNPKVRQPDASTVGSNKSRGSQKPIPSERHFKNNSNLISKKETQL